METETEFVRKVHELLPTPSLVEETVTVVSVAPTEPNKAALFQEQLDRYLASDLALAGDDGGVSHIMLPKERPEHRYLVYLSASGMGPKEIFEALGGVWDHGAPVRGTGRYSYNRISLLVRQPWFKQRALELMAENNEETVIARLKREVMPSLDMLTILRDDPKVPSNVRLNAAADLLNRFLGKPTQRIESNARLTIGQAADNAQALDAALAKVTAELNARHLTS